MQNQEQRSIAFLGMGIMGAAMARNLIERATPGSTDLKIYNRSKRPVLDELEKAGATVAGSIAECVSGCDVIFTCLGDEKDVENVITEAILPALAGGERSEPVVVCDFSTIGVKAAEKIADRLNAAGVDFIDAPVTGGDVGARNATLTIMAGGESRAFAAVKPLLERMGKVIVHCGKSGSGQALKLCNQVLCAVNLVAVVEAFALAERLGLPQNLVVDTLGSGAGGSWALNTLGPRIIKEDFAPGFAIRHMLKDLRLVKESTLGADGADGPTLSGTELAVQLFNEVLRTSGEQGAEMGTQAMALVFKG